MSKVDLDFNINKVQEEDQPNRPKTSDISGVRIQKKGPFKRFFSNLVKNDLRSAISDATDNVLLPDGEQLLVGFLEFVIESIFLGGEQSYFRGFGRRSNGDVPYASMFKSGKKIASAVKELGSNSTALAYDEVIFKSARDAQIVKDDMLDYIEQYHKVSILDLYSFIKDVIENPEDIKDGSFTDEDYGWKGDLSGVPIRPVRGGGYILVLPKPRYIK